MAGKLKKTKTKEKWQTYPEKAGSIFDKKTDILKFHVNEASKMRV